MREIRVNSYRVVEYNGSMFVEVFHHKYPNGGLFTSDQQCNQSRKRNLFSVLGSIDERFTINN